ncbi:MAG: glycerophosphodiester phosphodiesterase family protein [Pseudomonadota bacterium]
MPGCTGKSAFVLPGRPLNIAPRGARSRAPENTLAAARQALSAGADMWELDVRFTADQVPVVLHDDTLLRTSDVSLKKEFAGRQPWPVHEFTLAELRRLDFGGWFAETDPFGQIAAGKVSAVDLKSYKGEPAPTLEEALSFSKRHGLRVNIEIKDQTGLPGHDLAAAGTVRVVERLDLWDQVIISSFNTAYLVEVNRLKPQAATAVIVDEPPSDVMELLRSSRASGYHPNLEALRWEDVSRVRQAGGLVNVWTVNDAASMKELLTGAVTGLITDFPQVLASILKNRCK